MPESVQRTKLYPPPVAPDVLLRERLHRELDESAAGTLSLVCAPAGYGKSVLVSHWLSERGHPAVWVSLDAEDNDLRRFLSTLTAGFEEVVSDACPRLVTALAGPTLPPPSDLVAALSNDLDEIESRVFLVLDDFHHVKSSRVHEILTDFLAHPPRNVHLILITRHDPSLSFSRLRASGGMREIRLDALAFTAEEVAAFIRRAVGLSLSAEATQSLNDVLEGWPVGLRLVALSLRRQRDPEGFMKGLSGNASILRDYLVEEVLSKESPTMRAWLQRASVLDRFSAELCEAVCRSVETPEEFGLTGARFVEQVVRSGLFGIGLDDEGEWIRYHHVFRQLLASRLERLEGAERVAELNGRASRWFEARGQIDEAIGYALESNGLVDAGAIVESHRHEALNEDKWWRVERWLESLPSERVAQSSELLMAKAWRAHDRWRLWELEPFLGCVAAIEEERPEWDLSIPAEYLFLRGVEAYWDQRGPESEAFFREARSRVDPEHALIRGELEEYSSLAQQMNGRSDEAIARLEKLDQNPDLAKDPYRTRLWSGMTFVNLLSGDLAGAGDAAATLWRISDGEGVPSYARLWSCYLLGNIAYAQARDEAALVLLAQSFSVPYGMHARAAADAFAITAVLYQSTGRPEAARDMLQRLSSFATALDNRVLIGVQQSASARVAMLAGRVETARDWIRQGIEPKAESCEVFWCEVPRFTACEILLATGVDLDRSEATSRLETLEAEMRASHNAQQLIRVLALQARAEESEGRVGEASKKLEEAVLLAEPGRWMRPIVDSGRVLSGRLAELRDRGVVPDYVDALLGAISASHGERDALAVSAGDGLLTARELEILGLLAERLQDTEIASRLFVSRETVKSHLKRIYRKLSVHGRRDAVREGRKLGLLPDVETRVRH